MRDFDDKDRKKKSSRIKLDENPANLSDEMLDRLTQTVQAALKNGYLSCPVGWKVAQEMKIPRIAVGEIMDRLGIRVTDCQLGFFTVDKNLPTDSGPEPPSPQMITALHELEAAGGLTCKAVHDVASRLKIRPLRVSEAANALGLKIKSCQLGCF